MIPQPTSNLYQNRFFQQIATGASSTEAIPKIIHRYLDGKPAKLGKRNLSSTERDLDFWSAEFWGEVSVEIFDTESFALALARYLRQSKVTQASLLQKIVFCAPDSLRRAIRYSQIFLFPNELRWKEIKELWV